MISVEDALVQCLALVGPLPVEHVPLALAAGRYMPGPATASRDQPPFAASAMDGYAVQGDPTADDRFTVVGEAGAGHAWHGTLGPLQAARIFTGAPLPDGATRVIIQEDVIRDGDTITVKPGADAGTHIRPAGQDFRAGDTLPARLLRPNDLALLASMNVALAPVTRRPVVAIIATGDELVMPGETPGPDQIIASNSFTLKALAEEAGAEVRLLPIARDTVEALSFVLGLAEGADVIVTTGGASVGEHDLVAQVAESLGMQRAFWKIAMRPGKPLMAGRLGGAALLGLPGNPVSSVVCAHLFLLPMIRALLGLPADFHAPRPQPAVLAEDVGPTGPRAHYMRARLTQTGGLPRITPFDRQDSSLLSILSSADALLIRPAGDSPRSTGAPVTYLPI
ncbi:MAG: molybdopterin molybdotransferase MoeA [Pseudotabrizicola sp.]|uniref:molybdopterin molybdotransferase MoeA n=1 Tax=Pseudotabrizicola sp. TaxID=2939647 RepID=UPI00272F4EB1|nr:molybdopterin molybdotransferase MoeA [Pseudotabrizicola sp.]MDP2080875.1 molybdopterin molybdotransferase MoeA [Pseudotabrizicola sp.]MDZ7572723.1 molybdopterin molybdotransferase MoeA [Pseudotabrizicola sp.]